MTLTGTHTLPVCPINTGINCGATVAEERSRRKEREKTGKQNSSGKLDQLSGLLLNLHSVVETSLQSCKHVTTPAIICGITPAKALAITCIL